MKNLYTHLLLLILFTIPYLGYAQFTNNGATVVVESGASIIANGDFNNINNGDLTIVGEITVKGDLTNEGTLNADPLSTVKLNGTTSQTLNLNNATIQNFEIWNSFSDISLASSFTINGEVVFGQASNNLVLGDYNLKIGPKKTAETMGTFDRSAAAPGWVDAKGSGKLIRDYSGDITSLNFPIGDDTYYTPVIIDVTSGTVATGKIGIKLTNAAHPDLPSDATAYLTRYWDISTMGMGTNFSADLTATYNVNNDRVLIGSAVEEDIVGANYDGIAWDFTNGQNISPHQIKGTITGDRSFTGLNRKLIEWTGAVSQQWNNTDNWNSNSIPTIDNEVLIPSGLSNYPHLGSGLFAIGSNPNNGAFECYKLTIESGASFITLPNNKIENRGDIIIWGNMWVQNSAVDAFNNFSNSKIIIENAGELTFH